MSSSDYSNEQTQGQAQLIRKGEPREWGLPSGPAGAFPLSTAHIRPLYKRDAENTRKPQIQFVHGGSIIRTTKNRECLAVGGGKRGKIKGFSKQSRHRLMETIAFVRRDVELPNFVTLTYPEEFPTVSRAKRDLKIFTQRLQRKYPSAGGIWKLEPQERGAPHYHLMIWGCDTEDLLQWTVINWYEIAGNGDNNHYLFHAGFLKDSKPCVQKVRSWRGVWSYAAKYLGKTFEVAEWGSQWTGRFWGTVKRENIPFGELVEMPATYTQVVRLMRYQRRFMAMRRGRDNNSLKTFCDADQWVEKLIHKRIE